MSAPKDSKPTLLNRVANDAHHVDTAFRALVHASGDEAATRAALITYRDNLTAALATVHDALGAVTTVAAGADVPGVLAQFTALAETFTDEAVQPVGDDAHAAGVDSGYIGAASAITDLVAKIEATLGQGASGGAPREGGPITVSRDGDHASAAPAPQEPSFMVVDDHGLRVPTAAEVAAAAHWADTEGRRLLREHAALDDRIYGRNDHGNC